MALAVRVGLERLVVPVALVASGRLAELVVPVR